MKQNSILLKNITDALVNDGYAIIENALDPQLAKNLKRLAQKTLRFTQAGISSSKHVDTQRRSDSIAWLNEDNHEQSRYLHFTQVLQETLNKELYLGLRSFESHFSIYEKDAFYEKHLDSLKGSTNRVVSTVYYLNELWEDKDGGELLLYNEHNEVLKKIMPQANTLVVFLSERFAHEVRPTHKPRFSIAGWFRVDT